MAKIQEINVRQCPLPSCRKCNNGGVRDQFCKDGICDIPSAFDNLPIRCVGNWANDKIFYLTQYFGIFSTGMHKRWPDGLYYIEICSGPGRCSMRNGQEQDGTALAIVNHPSFKYLKRAVFIDYNDIAVETLNKRIANLGKRNAQAIRGDYYDSRSIINAIGNQGLRCLSLCLIDPTDCSVPFSTVEEIYKATKGKCDFIISFFDKTDFGRNCKMAAIWDSHRGLKEKYHRFLGDDQFFERKDIIDLANQGNHDKIVDEFKIAYKRKLSSLGLSYTDEVAVGSLYHLLFATGNSRGIDFWQKASKKCTPRGQLLLGL